MTIYGRSDISLVNVAGAGHTHERAKSDGNIAITCPFCETALLSDSATWTRDATRIPLTPDEVRTLEEDERSIAMFQQAQVAANAREALESTQLRKAPRRGAAR